MSSILEQARHAADSQINRVRWSLGLSGALSVALGAVIIIWPSISLYALVILWGAFTAANGVVGLFAAASGRIKQGRGWLVLWSLLSIAFGVAVLAYTNIGALAFLYVIGAYAVSLGIIAVGGAFWLPIDGGDRAVLALTGLVSILFGVVMFAKPGDGALVLLALIAAFELITGISQLVVAIGGKRLLEYSAKQAVSRAKPKPQTVSS
jgi:uncharacterized membrane protein HdeD (DUF308 family)